VISELEEILKVSVEEQFEGLTPTLFWMDWRVSIAGIQDGIRCTRLQDRCLERVFRVVEVSLIRKCVFLFLRIPKQPLHEPPLFPLHAALIIVTQL
jgi:hypothetical protein